MSKGMDGYRPPFSTVSYNGDYPDGEEPTCDICGRAQDDSPNVFDYGVLTEVDWNGETGNHEWCEKRLYHPETISARLDREEAQRG